MEPTAFDLPSLLFKYQEQIGRPESTLSTLTLQKLWVERELKGHLRLTFTIHHHPLLFIYHQGPQSPPPSGGEGQGWPYLLDQEGLLHDLGTEAPQPLDGLVLALAASDLLGGAQRLLQQHQAHPEDDLDSCGGQAVSAGGGGCSGEFLCKQRPPVNWTGGRGAAPSPAQYLHRRTCPRHAARSSRARCARRRT